MWANELVRDILYKDGGWEHSATLNLKEEIIAPWVDRKVLAKSEQTARKVVTNYAFLFRNVLGDGAVRQGKRFYNTRSTQWNEHAIRLTW